MGEQKVPGKKKVKKKRAEPVYVPVNYPVWFGAASFAWAVVGWLAAAFAPRLAFVPQAGTVHLLLPALTVALLGVNLYFAVRSLLRGAHVLRLAVVTGVEVALFTTLFFQLYAHVGAELYDAPGPTSPWQWLAFSAAHAFRAGDVFDAVEAFGWGIQPVKHTSPLVGVFVIAYHVVVDVFFLGLVWAAVGRFREALLSDDAIRDLVVRCTVGLFAVWFITWMVFAFFVRPWRVLDVFLWLVENVLRVVDFADVMESFGLRLHTLPREGVVGVLTLSCRLWIGLGLAVLLTRKRKPPPRRVLTPPGVAAWPYWRVRVGALAGMTAVLFAVGLASWLVSGSPAESLTAAVKEGPDARAEEALRALRRMGPSAGSAVEPLVAVRPDAPPAVRDGITRTLGYLGTSAAGPLRAIALAEPPESAGLAVDSLAEVGGPAAPDLVAVWSGTTDDGVKARAGAAIRRVGGAGVAPLIDGFAPENSHGHYVWLQRLDANWRMRGTTNPTALACHELPALKSRAASDPAVALSLARACGTAARELLEVAYENLNGQDVGAQSAAAGVVIATGPSETPKVLALARATPAKQSVGLGVLTVLNDPGMWTPAVLADRATLRALLALAERPEGLPAALPHLGHYGPAAAPAFGAIIPKVADPDAGTRATARAALTSIRPDWKTDPALTAATPTFLLRLSKLPPAESDELYAAIKPLSPEQGQALAGAVERELEVLDKQYRGIRLEEWDSGARNQYVKALDGVFGPVERLGPKANAATPALNTLLRQNEKNWNSREAPLANARLLVTLELIGGESGGTPAARLRLLGSEQEKLALIRSEGKEAVPHVREQLGGDDLALMFGLKAAAALERVAEPLVPDLIALLPKSNRRADANRIADTWVIPDLGRALNAADPAWRNRPRAAEALGGMLQLATNAHRSEGGKQRLFDLLAGADAAAVTKIAAETVRAGAVEPEVKALFDKAAPEWRADAAVKAAAPQLVPRLDVREQAARARVTLLDLGPAGVEALAGGLTGLSDAAVAGPSGYGIGAPGTLRDVILRLLKDFDPPAKAAAPALLGLAARPKLLVETVPNLIETLDKVSPGWAADPAYREARKAASDALLARVAENQVFLGYAGRFSADVAPLLVRDFEAATDWAGRSRVIARIAAAGPAAKGALPVLTKAAANTEDAVNRVDAVIAIGKVGAGDATLVPTLAPYVVSEYDRLREAAGRALDQVDPKWRTTPAAKVHVPAAKTLLTATVTTKRVAGAEALGLLGAGDPSHVPVLCPVVLDKEPPVRAAAGKALDAVDPEWRSKPAAVQAAAAAVKQLDAPEPRKRLDAVGALDVIRPLAAAAAIQRMLTRETDGNTRRYAEEVLARLRKAP